MMAVRVAERKQQVTTPMRVQRKRTKGFKLQAVCSNGLPTVYVGRPTKYGNPFNGLGTVELTLVWYREVVSGGWNPKVVPDYYADWQYRLVYEAQHNFVAGFREWNMTPQDAARTYLRGHDLACWCALCPAHTDGKPFDVECADCAPCHADFLLAICNSS